MRNAGWVWGRLLMLQCELYRRLQGHAPMSAETVLRQGGHHGRGVSRAFVGQCNVASVQSEFRLHLQHAQLHAGIILFAVVLQRGCDALLGSHTETETLFCPGGTEAREPDIGMIRAQGVDERLLGALGFVQRAFEFAQSQAMASSSSACPS